MKIKNFVKLMAVSVVTPATFSEMSNSHDKLSMHGMRATKIGRLWELKVWKTKREQQNQPFLPKLSAHGHRK